VVQLSPGQSFAIHGHSITNVYQACTIAPSVPVEHIFSGGLIVADDANDDQMIVHQKGVGKRI
jgi:hypothetical protein